MPAGGSAAAQASAAGAAERPRPAGLNFHIESGTASPAVSQDAHSGLGSDSDEDEQPVIGRRVSWINYPTSPILSTKNKPKAPGDVPRIGIDIGGVLTRESDPAYTGSTDEWDSTWMAPGAFDAVKKIVLVFGADNVFLVSKVRPGGNMHRRMEQWLHETVNFCDYTGVIRDNINFVPAIDGPDGKGAASNQLGLSHFVDDKFEVLRSLWEDPAGNVRHLVERHQGLLFHFAKGGWSGSPPECEPGEVSPIMRRHYRAVANWLDVLDQLRQKLPATLAQKADLLAGPLDEFSKLPIVYPANAAAVRAAKELPPWVRQQQQQRVVVSPTSWRATSAEAKPVVKAKAAGLPKAAAAPRAGGALQWSPTSGRPKLVLKPRQESTPEEPTTAPPPVAAQPAPKAVAQASAPPAAAKAAAKAASARGAPASRTPALGAAARAGSPPAARLASPKAAVGSAVRVQSPTGSRASPLQPVRAPQPATVVREPGGRPKLVLKQRDPNLGPVGQTPAEPTVAPPPAAAEAPAAVPAAVADPAPAASAAEEAPKAAMQPDPAGGRPKLVLKKREEFAPQARGTASATAASVRSGPGPAASAPAPTASAPPSSAMQKDPVTGRPKLVLKPRTAPVPAA